MEQKPFEKVYNAFFQSGLPYLYFNQIKEITGLSDSSLSNTLKKMVTYGEIKKISKKANTYYTLKNDLRISTFFTFFDLEKLENLNLNVYIPLKSFLSLLPHQVAFVVLFGSASQKQESSDSDIDVLVVLHKLPQIDIQKEYQKIIKNKCEEIKEKVNATSLHPLSLIYTDTETFLTNKDRVLVEARETGYCIFGHSLFYGVMLHEWKNKPMAVQFEDA